jgi:hypothetical protein
MSNITKNDRLLYCLICLGMIIAFLISCKPKTTLLPQRTYRMGFQNSAPKIDFNLVIQSLDTWTLRSDAAIISYQVPWDSLYSGVAPVNYLNSNFKSLVDFYRSKNFKLWVYIDPGNGLNRAADALDLAALGKSMAQSEVQQLYIKYCFAIDSLFRPEHLGLAVETNAIRGLAPDSIYQGIKTAATVAATKIKAYDANVKLGISVQAEYAWGLFTNKIFLGVEQDFTDFPFLEELGISSYPYFCYNLPSDIPSNYYSRLIAAHNTPVFISENGWSSKQVGSFDESTQKQSDYITKQAELLDLVGAIGYFQLTFTDIDIASTAPGTPSSINQFAYIGLVDSNLVAKPALASWDQVFKRPLKPGN